jgi:hypothetical protein
VRQCERATHERGRAALRLLVRLSLLWRCLRVPFITTALPLASLHPADHLECHLSDL